MSMFLELDHVRLAYDTARGMRVITQDLCLGLAQGHIGCLLGASGCGKSTVLRAIAGFEPVRQGRIVLGGRLLSSPGQQVLPELRQVGMMFQDYALFPHMNVAGNVGFGLRRQGRARREARVAELLEMVGLSRAGDSFPHELSGGQQQRVALARALAPRPKLLLADEPTGNLDGKTGRAVVDLLFGLKQQSGATLVLVTHDERLAKQCERTIRMADGRIVSDEQAVVAA